MCVLCLCLLFVCLCMCACACVYVWVTHCGQTPAHRLLVWLMNQCLQGVFEEVYCMPLFYSLKHPVLRLPLHSKEKINPLLTPPQWMASATVPSAISPSSEQKEKRIMDAAWEKREIQKNSNNRLPSLVYLPIISMKELIKKNSPKTFSFSLFFFSFLLFSLYLISLLFVMSHLLSFMCRMVCQGRLEAGACASTAIVQYQYCDGWGAACPHISSECKDNWKEETSQTWHPSHFKESLSRRNETSPDKAKLSQDKSK